MGYIRLYIGNIHKRYAFGFIYVCLRKAVALCRHSPRLEKDTVVPMLKYCIPLIPTIILWWIINVSDQYMVTYFNGVSQSGIYTAAYKIPNFVVIFASIFIDAWQLSAVDEYDNDGKSRFFSQVFRVYSGALIAVGAVLIAGARIITRLYLGRDYYDSWHYVPILVIATTFSCLVNFYASVYMAEKRALFPCSPQAQVQLLI